MKKDIFNGNIKREFVSYIWTSIIVVAVISFGFGGFICYAFINMVSEPIIGGVIMGAFFCLLGIVFTFGTVFVIRKYPKYPKLRRFFINSDAYFVGSNSKEYHGHWRGRAAFDSVMLIGEQNRGLDDIKYPPKYRIYIVLTIIGIALMFAFIFITWKVTENIELLPKALQNEYVVFGSFAAVEIADIVLSFVFAFKVRKIRKETKEKYEEMCWGWRYSLSSALVDISDRSNNKKHKFWYDVNKLEEIEKLVNSASENAELKFEKKGNKLVSFSVIDTLNNSVSFTGYFI